MLRIESYTIDGIANGLTIPNDKGPGIFDHKIMSQVWKREAVVLTVQSQSP